MAAAPRRPRLSQDGPSDLLLLPHFRLRLPRFVALRKQVAASTHWAPLTSMESMGIIALQMSHFICGAAHGRHMSGAQGRSARRALRLRRAGAQQCARVRRRRAARRACDAMDAAVDAAVDVSVDAAVDVSKGAARHAALRRGGGGRSCRSRQAARPARRAAP